MSKEDRITQMVKDLESDVEEVDFFLKEAFQVEK